MPYADPEAKRKNNRAYHEAHRAVILPRKRAYHWAHRAADIAAKRAIRRRVKLAAELTPGILALGQDPAAELARIAALPPADRVMAMSAYALAAAFGRTCTGR